MAHFGKDLDNFSASRTLRIKGAETTEHYTIYTVEVSVGSYTWTVKHRYNDFLILHEKLVSVCKIDKTLLPPKKMFGNQSEGFIKKRQAELEAYLQTVLYYVAHKVPPVLANFLDFSKYEIHGITQSMAEDLYNRGDTLLQAREMYEVTPLQLYSLTERLKLPEPTCDSGDVKKDIGHILDFITRVKLLKVTGSTDPIGTSNIDMSQLKFDLSLFKSLQCLEVSFSVALQISGIDTIKQTMDRVSLHYCISKIRDILLQDLPQWKADDGTLLVSYWDKLTEADFSHNTITEIDDSVQLMPRVEVLNLGHNHINTIQHLNWLSRLTCLDLSFNTFKTLDALHTKIGNLKTLNLAGNRLDSLQGLSKLFSLENLDVSYNEISQMTEVLYVCKLPCLEELHMNNNPVTTVLDYRTKLLSMFMDRASEVILDDQKPSQKELDTVAVSQAIQKSKENKSRKSITRKSISDDQPSDSPVLPDLYEEEGSPQASSTGVVGSDGEGGHTPIHRQTSHGDRSPTSSGSWTQSLVFLQQAGPDVKAPVEPVSTQSYDENLGDGETVPSQ